MYLSLMAFLWKSLSDMAFLRMLIDWKMPLLPVTTWQMGSGILRGIVSTSMGFFRGTHSFGGMIWNEDKQLKSGKTSLKAYLPTCVRINLV